jgi:hypothetical protein
MPEAVTVWAVELGRGVMRERRGTLSLASDALVFEAADGFSHIRIALADLSRARRVRGSPVLMIAHRGSTGSERTAFYFVQPPPLDPVRGGGSDRVSVMSMARQSRRRTRRQNVSYLGVWNQEKKQEVAEWQRAIRSAAGAAHG